MSNEYFNDFIILKNNDNDEKAKPPHSITLELKHHQLILLNKCYTMEKDNILINKRFIADHKLEFDINVDSFLFNTNIGCIVNNSNSGKSIVILALIDQPVKKSRLIDFENNEFSGLVLNNLVFKNNNIIVVSPVIYFQWEFYIKNYTTYNFGFVDKKIDFEKVINEKKHILLSTTYYKDFQKFSNLKNYLFDRVIYDDCDSLNISNCKQINSKFYWFLSSNIFNLLNPSNVINSRNSQHNRRDRMGGGDVSHGIKCNGFIKNTFIKIRSLKYKKLFFIKNDDVEIDNSFNFIKPNIFKIEYNKKSDNIIFNNNCLPAKLSSSILSNNIDDAINNFFKPYKSIDDVLYEISLLNIFETEKDLYYLKDRIEYNIDPISLCEIEIKTILQCCFQSYDFTNLLTYYTFQTSPKCPTCRADVDLDKMMVVYDKDDSLNASSLFDSKTKSRKDILIHLVNNIISKSSKILIYANTPKIYKTLDDLKLKYREIKGAVSTIKKSIELSKSGNVLILNQKTVNYGLNLGHITDLIIFSDIDKNYYDKLARKCYAPFKSLNIFEFV